MARARAVQKNLRVIGINSTLTVLDDMIMVSGINRKGEPFNIRLKYWHAERAELIALLAAEDAKLDQDVAALEAEARRIAAEAAAAKNVKALSVPISKAASRILADEISRRLELGHCPPLELLAEQAIRQDYG